MRKAILLFALLCPGLLAAVAAKGWLIEPPALRRSNGAGEFDSVRAKSRLAVLLGDERPHQTDTAANDAVRARIVAQLRRLGLQPRVQEAMACNELYKSRGVSCARVRNVVAVLGPSAGRAVLLNTHYDSNGAGPGAADAGAGVATLLEVASILRRERLHRPVILLFNEGEELGLIGARAFLADPLSRSVDSLINLEARGVRGPVNMFETSKPNGAAIAAFAGAVERPIANSLSVDVYRLLPNYTDVNTFAERAWTTLNLAMIGNETRYHSAGDNLAALDLRSLQHMGDQTLALARELARAEPQPGGERIFMDVAGLALITLPLWLGAVLPFGMAVTFAVVAWKRRGLGRGVAAVAGALVVSVAVAWAGVTLVGALRPGMFWRAYPIWTHLAVYASALLACTAVLGVTRRKLEQRQLRASFWLSFLLIGLAVWAIAPGGIVYFLFPPLAALAGMILRRWWSGAEAAGAWLAIVLLWLTLGAMLALLEELLNQGPMSAFAPLAALLFLPVLIEARPMLRAMPVRVAVTIAAVPTLLGWAAAAAAPTYSSDRQQQFSFEHVTDSRKRLAYWSVLNDHARLPADLQKGRSWALGKLLPTGRQRWLATAPALLEQPAPAVELLRSAGSRERRLRLRLRPNGAPSVTLVADENSRVLAAGVPGFLRKISPDARSGPYSVSCFGRSCDGAIVDVVIGRPAPVTFTLIGSKPGLPPSAKPLLAARPRFARPQYVPDSTIVISAVRF